MISSSAKTKKHLSTAPHTGHHHTAPHHTGHHHTSHRHTAPHHIITHHTDDVNNIEGSLIGKAIYFLLGSFAVLAFVLAILAIGGYINYNDVPISAIDGKLIENTSKTDSKTLINYNDSFELSTTSSSADLLLENENNKLNISTDIQLTSGTAAKPQLTVAPGGVFLESLLDMGGQNIVDVNQMTISSIVPEFLGSLTTTEINANKFTLNKITTPPKDTGTVGDVRLMLTNGSATFTGSIASTTLTVASTPAVTGTIFVGMIITGPGVLPNTIVTSFGTGSGGAGTYILDKSQTITPAVAMAGSSVNRIYINSASNDWNYINLSTIDKTSLMRGSGFIPSGNINNVFNSSIERIGDIIKTTIVFSVIDLNYQGTTDTIIGDTGANSYLCYLERSRVGTITYFEIETLHPCTGVTVNFNIYRSTDGTQSQGATILPPGVSLSLGTLDTTGAGNRMASIVDLSSSPFVDEYIYICGAAAATAGSFTGGFFRLTCYGY